MLVASGLVPLLVAPLDNSWSSCVHTTDASMSGWGSCECVIGPEIAKAHGVWSERWRFKRLEPSEWCPRRRALKEFSFADLVSDPRTLGEQYSEQLQLDVASEGAVPSGLQWRKFDGFP